MQVDALDPPAERHDDDGVADLVRDGRGDPGHPSDERHERQDGAHEERDDDEGRGCGGQATSIAAPPRKTPRTTLIRGGPA
ncbi:hypothetical protein [Curtobacterium sp. ISL-83]|uniref:hypothetical protein n=1 Tax=Curtobacterium sp. ISL-83 TaxID=2819145 RepID=UPI002035A622|nr:hypothetical protein [Curtobacterium sp. ISL-83]